MKDIIKYKKKIYYNPLFIKITRLIIPIIMYFLKTKIVKLDGKIPNRGPLLIAAHHEELADHFVILLHVKRRLFWVADTSHDICLADTRIRKYFMGRLGVVPIDKHNTQRNTNLFDYLIYLLMKGEAIVFFPEGCIRSERDGKKFGSFKDGVIRLALEYEKRFNKEIPIYPVGIKYKKEGKIKNAYLRIGKGIIIQNRDESIKVFNEIKRLSF